MMSGYEIIRRNIEFDHPERVGLRFNSLGFSDVFRIYVQPPTALIGASSTQIRMDRKIRTQSGESDEWGCYWETIGEISGDDMGQVLDPPLKDLKLLSDFHFPDPYDPAHFEGLEIALEEARDQFVQLNSPFCLFERLHFLHGFENTMNDLVLNPQDMGILMDRVIDYQIGIVEMAGKLGKGRIHCFDTTDDWGTQTNLFISPKMWRVLFKPRYKRLVDAVHANGMYIRFHSDGKINAILNDLIEIGMDILNVHQPLLLGIDEISHKFRGRVCFEVSVDIQNTLPQCDKKVIQDQVRELIEKWATPTGGLIGVEYRYGTSIGITRQALKWELESFQEFGTHKK